MKYEPPAKWEGGVRYGGEYFLDLQDYRRTGRIKIRRWRKIIATTLATSEGGGSLTLVQESK